MKKLLFIFTILLSISCTTTNNQEIDTTEEIVPKDIQLIFTTTRPNFDEVTISYFDYDLNDWNYGPYQFEYDNEGNPLPLTLSFTEYEYASITGDAYRNNTLPYQFKVQVYVDGELVLEDADTGVEEDLNTDEIEGSYATIYFNYDIY